MELVKQVESKPQRDEMGRLLPGNTANPNGRPKRKTIKERLWEYLEEHPDDMVGFIEYFAKQDRSLAWQMLEGRPQQDVTTAGEKLPTPIYGGISGHLSDKEDIQPQKAN